MGAQFRDILSGLYLALRADHDTYDLRTVNGTHRVVWSEAATLPVIPAPFVVLGGLVLNTSYSESDMGAYDLRGSLDWAGFVAAPDLTPEARALAAIDLANDVISALQNGHADPTNTGLHNLQRLLINMEGIAGDDNESLAGHGVCFGKITFQRISVNGI